MSNIRDRGVIDITLEEDGKYILIIADDMEWGFDKRQNHVRLLQDKINDYLSYIGSGQAAQAKPGLRPIIRVLAKCAYSQYAIDYLERVKAFVKQKDDICDVEWTHSAEDGPFEDGWSDDFVFDSTKIYPRLKKNWADNPLESVAMTPPDASSPNYPDQMVMIRWMDSYIGMFVQDMGNVLTYITYDLLPEDTDVMELQKKAFENLARDITYRSAESKEPGICGILAGGDFEAESLCINSIWEQVSGELNDDVLICVPTKDIVFYTAAGDSGRVKKMFRMAKDMYEQNQKETPYLIFSNDVFLFDRTTKTLSISKQHNFMNVSRFW